MRIILAAGVCLFDDDETDILTGRLGAALKRRGHLVEIVRLNARPCNPAQVVSQTSALRNLRFDHGDRLITLGWPAILLEHRSKTVLLGRRTVCGGWLPEVQGEDASWLARQERLALEGASRILAMSDAAALAAREVHGLVATPFGLPRPAAGPAPKEERGDALVLALRHMRDPKMRLDLVFAAAARSRSPVSLVLLGERIKDADREACIRLARDYGLEGRVAFAADVTSAHTGWQAVVDMAQPGLTYGLGIGDFMVGGRPAIVAEGSDAWDVARCHKASVAVRPEPATLAAAIDALPPLPAAPPSSGETPDWEDFADGLAG